ncbi:MAG: excinuclease ABC subunit UvrA [Polyangiaceae bacterium]|jgi:excinuclease ABC subunit A|nr:excinuclease ABC subunit UvrA [Polyangiaceae bacterium]
MEKAATRAQEPASIEITGAREHNLDVPRLSVPKNRLVVFTGPSGSGKSSLAFDTLYAEGQRRYVESLSAYARQFLGQLERPSVERLQGLSPTIAIEQKSASGNPRSTVGTITEIYDYMRVLWARVGVQHCPSCGKVVQAQTAERICEQILAMPAGAKATVVAPLMEHRKGEHARLWEELRERGFARVMVDGAVHSLESPPKLDKKKKHSIGIAVDRLTLGKAERGRLTDSVETALREGGGELLLHVEGEPEPRRFSQARACCGMAFPRVGPQHFSFNGPLGMCPSCHGLGENVEPDPELIIPDPSRTIRDGAIAPWASAMERGEGWTFRIIDTMAQACDVDLDVPWNKLPKKKREIVLFGLGGEKLQVSWGSAKSGNHGTFGVRFEGVIPSMERRYHETTSELAREHYRKFCRQVRCAACGGQRLRPESLAVRVSGAGIAEVTRRSVDEAVTFFQGLSLAGNDALIAEGVLREINARLGFLVNVGLGYLTLDRAGPTLSGGEAQRIRLASQLGSELSGVMYVLDEPSIGLHPRDNRRLISTLERLRDLGNTVLVVEHDEETMLASDWIIDFGPGAGAEGGKVLFSGTPAQILAAEGSVTGDYLAGRRRIDIPSARRKPRDWLWIRGAREHNLRGIDVKIPLGVLCAVTGVSGAGKSSLVNGILLPALGKLLHRATEPVGAHDRIENLEAIDRCIAIDQQPIGRMPRSNPATYTKAFDLIREFFAQLPEARARGFDAGRFSFNVKGGRCEGCQGGGVVRVEMHFLADVFITCETCGGGRYNAQTLSVRYRGHSIADVLQMRVSDALQLFEKHPQLSRILHTLQDVGLGYMQLGQTAPTLSGGEAQRVKLSRELSKSQTGNALYVLDEPTTGLHFEDVRRLLGVLERLVEAGNTVLVVEHNLDVIKRADWVIDLGPEGGSGGGELIAQGTPEQVARSKRSYTGQALRPLLDRGV